LNLINAIEAQYLVKRCISHYIINTLSYRDIDK